MVRHHAIPYHYSHPHYTTSDVYYLLSKHIATLTQCQWHCWTSSMKRVKYGWNQKLISPGWFFILYRSSVHKHNLSYDSNLNGFNQTHHHLFVVSIGVSVNLPQVVSVGVSINLPQVVSVGVSVNLPDVVSIWDQCKPTWCSLYLGSV